MGFVRRPLKQIILWVKCDNFNYFILCMNIINTMKTNGNAHSIDRSLRTGHCAGSYDSKIYSNL